ncbi:Rmf/CrpP family protein [Ralstonia sp. Ralssp135]|uniref:ribosome modulation factor n=1 Tax=Ralstonia sp. Ralssp135 TaxID=3243016 RepID=UPI0039AE9688
MPYEVQSKRVVREQGAQARKEGKPITSCLYEEGTEARKEWMSGYQPGQCVETEAPVMA